MVLTTRPPVDPHDDEAQALFKEARRRRRRRRLLIAAAVTASAGIVVAGLAVFASGSRRRPPSVRTESSESLVDLAVKGVSGSFSEVYRLTGATDGTVEVAQRASPGHSPFITGPGKWSFVFQATTGFSAQWIEEGSTAWSCWHWPGIETWTCGGPSRFYGANGFELSIGPYVPGIVLDETTQLKSKPPQISHITYYASSSRSFGALRCVRVEGTVFQPISACFDHRGILVSQVGGVSSPWATITLLSYRSSVPASAFNLKAKSSGTDVVFPSPPL